MTLEQDWNVSIQNYTLLKHLGGGGYGTVFLASYYPDDSLRALKVLHQLGYDPERRFEREIRILQERSNSNSVQILDFGVTNAGHKYYAMEYCPLGDIKKFIGLINVTFALRVLESICYALIPFHSRGGFHRDIKPDNILIVQENGDLIFKLSDFGLAQDNNTSSVFTNNAAGTLGYIAPEIIAGRPFTSASDIYSLGITIRELVGGSVNNQAMSKEKFGNLVSVLVRMLSREPEKRIELDRLQRMVQVLLQNSTESNRKNTTEVVPQDKLIPEF